MKTPRTIIISTKYVHEDEILGLIDVIESEPYLDHREEETKITIFFIKNLEVALWIMYYLEKGTWSWNSYNK